MSVISIVIAERQTLLREGISRIIELEPDFEVVGTADCSEELYRRFECRTPDVVILDLNLGPQGGVELASELRERYPKVKIILFGADLDDDALIRALTIGINGVLPKDSSWNELLSHIRFVMHGQMMMPDSVARKLSGKLFRLMTEERYGTRHVQALLEKFRFTEKEYEISMLMAKGLNNRQIAEALMYSDGTVRNYVSSVYEKIGVKDRARAVILLRDSGIRG
ncbi:response regulator transcription factor [Paenibacillus sp. TRM 82003]|nr:response regulator transcription factor [Paenibacillus sp. TRM 82003]